MQTMKYISIPKEKTVQIKEMEKPVPQQGEALIKLLYGGICGSDLGTYRGTFLYSSFPRIPGHEFSAKVISVPKNNAGIEPGMIVTGNPYFHCGNCYSCRRGLSNCCTQNETLGAQRDGIFREYFAIPPERLYHGRGLDAQTLALIEPFCISYHAVKRGRVRQGDRVLVVGAGPIGILALMAAKMMGAEVAACDLNAGRLEKAKEMGADHTFLATKGDFLKAAASITGGDGFDACIECAGLPEAFQNCVDAAAYRGRVVVVGIGKEPLDFTYSKIQTKELDIFGSRNANKDDFLELIGRALEGQFDLKKLISSIYPFPQAAKAFRVLNQQNGTTMKVLLDFTSGTNDMV